MGKCLDLQRIRKILLVSSTYVILATVKNIERTLDREAIVYVAFNQDACVAIGLLVTRIAWVSRVIVLVVVFLRSPHRAGVGDLDQATRAVADLGPVAERCLGYRLRAAVHRDPTGRVGIIEGSGGDCAGEIK